MKHNHPGTVLVWGEEDWLRFHGALQLTDEPHPLLGSQRINLTVRKADKRSRGKP